MPMPKDATTPGAYALQLLDLVTRWGVTERAMLEPLALSAEGLAAPGARVTYDTLSRLIRRAHELTREPALAVYMGRQMRLSSHGALGLATMTAKTVGDTLELAERFFATRSMIVDVAFQVEANAASLVLQERAPLTDEEREVTVLSLVVMFVQIAQTIAERPIELAADVTFAEPSYAAEFAELSVVRFGRAANRLVFPTEALRQPLRMTDPVTAKLARDQLERELSALGTPHEFLVRAREAIVGNDGFRSLDELALQLHVSTRTLKRRFAEAGKSFSDLLDEVRKERALLLLGDHRLNVDAIAAELGYSDVANFARAFRRWTGETPSEYRNR